MSSNKFISLSFFGFFRSSPILHFYLMQLVIFFYIAYRFASRDYTIYGLIEEKHFDYPFNLVNELYPIPLSHFTTFQFIYNWIDHPGVQTIAVLQLIVVVSCILGAIGVLPKLNAIIGFVFSSHITGFMLESDSPLDGGSIALSALLILAISPKNNFYNIRNKYRARENRSIHYHWPITLLFMVVGYFYLFAGISKLVDIGPHWPFVLHIEKLAAKNIEDVIFLSNRYSNPFISSMLKSEVLSVVSATITLIGELGVISILFFPRGRFFFITSMVILHSLVFYTGGINFIGSSFILLLCFDYNRLARKATVSINTDYPALHKLINKLKKMDVFNLITLQLKTNASSNNIILLADENGKTYRYFEALEQMVLRFPMLLPLGIYFFFPGAIYLNKFLFKKFCS